MKAQTPYLFETILFAIALLLFTMPLVTLPHVAQPLPGYLNLWLWLGGLSAMAGLATGLFVSKKGFGFLFSLAGIISLLMMQINKNPQQYGAITFTWAYWTMLALFALTGSISYLKRQNNAGPADTTSKALNINIITTKTDTENQPVNESEKTAKRRKK